jgi:hypothetical protein
MQIIGDISFKCGNVAPDQGFIVLVDGANLDEVSDAALDSALTDEWPYIVEDQEWGQISTSALWIAREDALDDSQSAQAAAERIARSVGASHGTALRVASVERIIPGIILAEPLA